MVELKFANTDARPKTITVHVSQGSIGSVMAWYGAYHAGDRYAVYTDGVKLMKDRNGELVPALVESER